MNMNRSGEYTSEPASLTTKSHTTSLRNHFGTSAFVLLLARAAGSDKLEPGVAGTGKLGTGVPTRRGASNGWLRLGRHLKAWCRG